MHEIDVRSLDLNLLVTLDVVLDERHVTKAAARLGRSQSAVSHALARLRDHLGDPILVRVGGRMEPTPRARQLYPEVKRVLQTVSRILSRDVGWVPATSNRTFRLAGPDFVSSLLPSLIAHMAKEAPGVQLELVLPSPGMLRDLALGRFDLAIATADLALEDGLRRHDPIELGWAVFARRQHPALKDWGIDAWLAYPHLRIRTAGDQRGPIDTALEQLGRNRREGPSLPHFMLAPPLLAESDMLLTVPAGVLAGVADRFDLVAMPCPIEPPPIRLAVFESLLSAADPAVVWFRAALETALQARFSA